MENLSTTVVPLGSLATLFAMVSVLLFVKKAIKAREAEGAIKNRMDTKLEQTNISLSEQKKRLEALLKK